MSIAKNHTTRKTPTWQALLHQRGISDSTIDALGIRANGRGWVYPVQPGHAVRRWKAFPGQGGAKYLWKPSKPSDVTFYDPRGELAAHIAAADGVLVLAAGEPDVWALHEAGIQNATCLMLGEGGVPDWLLPELARLRVLSVVVYPDRDSAGQRFAQRLQARLVNAASFTAYQLPAEMGTKYDINALLMDVGRDELPAALQACAVWNLPPVAEPERPRRDTLPDLPAEYGNLYEQWCGEVERAALQAWNIAPPNGKNLSRRNFKSPYRKDARPSAQWNYTTHGFTDYGQGGEHSNTRTVAELLGVQSWDDYKREHAPAKASDNVTSFSGGALRVFPDGFPTTMARRLRTVNRRIGVEDHTPAEMVGIAWHAIVAAGVLPHDAIVSAAEFRRANKAIGENLSRDTVETGLKQLSAFGTVRQMSLEACGTNAYSDKSRTVRYQFLPWPEQQAAFESHWRYILREHAYQYAPDNVQPEWGDLDDDEVAALDDLRAPVYERLADLRGEAKQKYTANVTMLEGDQQRIAEGRYRAAVMPVPGLRNAREYRRALCVQRLRTAPKGAPLGKLACELGVTSRTIRRMADDEALGLVFVEQTKTLALSDLDDYQRENLAYLKVSDEEDGRVTIRTEGRIKLRDVASEEECKSHDERIACKAPAPPAPAESKTSQPKVETARESRRRVTIYANYSDEHKLRQLNWTPGALDLPRHDEETGEVYTPDELWRALAEQQASADARKETEDMPTFVVYAEPVEKEPTPEPAEREREQLNAIIADQAAPVKSTPRPLLKRGEKWGFYLPSGMFWALIDQNDPRIPREGAA